MSGVTLEELVRQLPDFPGPDWWRDTRKQAAARFLRHGLPDRRVENWKYSSLAGLGGQAFTLQPGEVDLERVETIHPEGICLVWVDGVLDLKRSRLDHLPEGLTIQPLQHGVESAEPHVRQLLEQLPDGRDMALVHLNTALTQQGVLVSVDAGCRVEAPVEMHYFHTGGARTAQVRNLVLLHHHAGLNWVEMHHLQPDAAGLANFYSQVWQDEHSRLQQVRIQPAPDAGESRLHLITRTDASLQAGAVHDLYALDLGGCMARHDSHDRLEGEGARSRMQGAWVLQGSSHVDNHLRVDHLSPGCESQQRFRGVMDDRSRGVFNGKVVVHPGADGTEAHQNNANLLLSPQAEVDTKPELEIYADEVVCSHGATVGQLDENALFYLRARGIAADEARRTLMHAFCQETLETLLLEAVREWMRGLLQRHLEARES